MYLLFLFLAFTCIYTLHSYLLISQRGQRKWSISEHAAVSPRTYRQYVFGHFLGGAFFLLYAKQFYLDTRDLPALFILSLCAVLLEWLQSTLPARGKTNAAHSLAAYVMWVLYIVVGWGTALLVPVAPFWQAISLVLMASLTIMFLYVHFNRSRLYVYQMLMSLFVFISLFIQVSLNLG